MKLKYSKYTLMILVASILALTSSLLTALGMAELFQGLFIIFLVIDLGRFLVLNFIVDEWNNLRKIKWVITIILGVLFIYSAVGIYNKLNSMIPDSIQTAMISAASYNKAQDNAEIKHTRSSDLAEVAQAEYQKSMDLNTKDYENCIKRANGVADAENACNNTKRRLDRSASSALKEAMKTANTDLDKIQTTTTENTKNQGEIAGVLTTVCKLIPGTDCKTYDGLQSALTVIILLVICGLDYLQLSIVLAVNTRKNKETVSINEKVESLKDEMVKTNIKPVKKVKKIKHSRKSSKIVKKENQITDNLEKEVVVTESKVEEKSSLNNQPKITSSFSHKTDFYK